MGRSRQREIGALVVEHKPKDLAGVVKILSIKRGAKENRVVTFSAVLEVEAGSETDKKYHKALVTPPVTVYPSSPEDLENVSEGFFRKTVKYLERKGFKIYK